MPLHCQIHCVDVAYFIHFTVNEHDVSFWLSSWIHKYPGATKEEHLSEMWAVLSKGRWLGQNRMEIGGSFLCFLDIIVMDSSTPPNPSIMFYFTTDSPIMKLTNMSKALEIETHVKSSFFKLCFKPYFVKMIRNSHRTFLLFSILTITVVLL